MSYQLHHGEALEVLRTLPDDSVHCVVTSPPYWGLRDYGTGRWEGGTNPECKHQINKGGTAKSTLNGSAQNDAETLAANGCASYKSVCKRCGAKRVDQQLGLEESVDEFIDKLATIFDEVRRVLRPDGTCWVNLGDSYCGNAGGGQGLTGDRFSRTFTARIDRPKRGGDLKPKDMVGVPWMFAFEARRRGWYLRSEIIWHKPNPMPESIEDRPTRAHEQLFLLTKSASYFYDKAAIMEKVAGTAHARGHGVTPKSHKKGQGVKNNESWNKAVTKLVDKRNKRDVWTVQSEPYDEAHFATFPPQLVRPCVLAGSPKSGVVLDPFCGSGTTGAVALELGRHFIGIDLKAEYIELAHKRVLGAAESKGVLTPELSQQKSDRSSQPSQLGLIMEK